MNTLLPLAEYCEGSKMICCYIPPPAPQHSCCQTGCKKKENLIFQPQRYKGWLWRGRRMKLVSSAAIHIIEQDVYRPQMKKASAYSSATMKTLTYALS